MSLHIWCCPGSPQAKQLCHLHAQPSLEQSCYGQKSLASTCAGSLQSCPTLCDPVDCGLPGFSVGGSPGRNTGEYWPTLAAIPSRAPHFLLPQLPTPLRTWSCQNPSDPRSCTTSTPGPHRGNPSPPGQPQEQTPVGDPHAEVNIRPQLKPRGSAAKEEDPKPPHQLYRLQIKSTWSTRQTRCLRNI